MVNTFKCLPWYLASSLHRTHPQQGRGLGRRELQHFSEHTFILFNFPVFILVSELEKSKEIHKIFTRSSTAKAEEKRWRRAGQLTGPPGFQEPRTDYVKVAAARGVWTPGHGHFQMHALMYLMVGFRYLHRSSPCSLGVHVLGRSSITGKISHHFSKMRTVYFEFHLK